MVVLPSNWELVHGHQAEESSSHSRGTDDSRECLAARVDSVRTIAAQGGACKNHPVDEVVVGEVHRCLCG